MGRGPLAYAYGFSLGFLLKPCFRDFPIALVVNCERVLPLLLIFPIHNTSCVCNCNFILIRGVWCLGFISWEGKVILNCIWDMILLVPN